MSYTRPSRKSNYKKYNMQAHDSHCVSLRCHECENYLTCRNEEKIPEIAYRCFRRRRQA